MLTSRSVYLALGLLLAGAPAFAQSTVPTDPNAYNRDVDQQQRIENGLQDGQLSTREAAHLEKGEAHIDHMEAVDEKNGMTPAEQAQINRAQNAESQRIYNDNHNSIQGHPNSASSQRMQADVQRNVDQQQRIDNGVKNGSLTNSEAGKLERGQAHVDRSEYRNGRSGHLSAAGQHRIQTKENHQSKHIYTKKHNRRIKS